MLQQNNSFFNRLNTTQEQQRYRPLVTLPQSYGNRSLFTLNTVCCSLIAFLPAPALFGTAIDTSCIKWKQVCNKKSSCGYYDNNILRNRLEITQKTYQTQRHSTSTSLLTIIYHMCLTPCRFLGLQVGYKIMGILLLMMLGWKVQRTQEYSLEKPEGLL